MTDEQRRQRFIGRLEAGAEHAACGVHIAALVALRRAELYNTLAFERLERKNRDINDIHRSTGENWNQTFYIMLLRTIGGMDNRRPFEELAGRATYAAILRERDSLHKIEALLLGTSGLLDLYRDDEYTIALKREYHHLRNKYSVSPLDASAWNLARIYPHNHPTLRLAQIASFLYDNELVMNRILECRTPDDVYSLFRSEASSYWTTHFIPSAASRRITKRIGRTKSELLGINLVAQMQFAYGSYIGSETLRDRAVTLLERIPPEDNRFTRSWNRYGRLAENAFDSQSLLQLSREYCSRRRCAECPVGARILKKSCGDCSIAKK